jgi:predicted transcriptional regulator
MNATLTNTETLVHKAVVNLYELHDADAVTAVDVSKHLGLPWGTVRSSMVSLQTKGVMDLDSSTENVVVRCDNLGYYPLAKKEGA